METNTSHWIDQYGHPIQVKKMSNEYISFLLTLIVDRNLFGTNARKRKDWTLTLKKEAKKRQSTLLYSVKI